MVEAVSPVSKFLIVREFLVAVVDWAKYLIVGRIDVG